MSPGRDIRFGILVRVTELADIDNSFVYNIDGYVAGL